MAVGPRGREAALEARWQARSELPAVSPHRYFRSEGNSEIGSMGGYVPSVGRGGFKPQDYLLLDNRIYRGQVGYHLIALAESQGLLVPVNLGLVGW